MMFRVIVALCISSWSIAAHSQTIDGTKNIIVGWDAGTTIAPHEFGSAAGASSLLNAAYAGNVDRPPQYLKIVLITISLSGFLMSCILGLKGNGNAFYLVGGWIIAVVSGSAVVWWWV
jgi:hypothetical protein